MDERTQHAHLTRIITPGSPPPTKGEDPAFEPGQRVWGPQYALTRDSLLVALGDTRRMHTLFSRTCFFKPLAGDHDAALMAASTAPQTSMHTAAPAAPVPPRNTAGAEPAQDDGVAGLLDVSSLRPSLAAIHDAV